METGQTAPGAEQQPAVRRLSFAAWLRHVAGGGAGEEAVSEASASDAEEADLPQAAPEQQQASSSSSSAAGAAASTSSSSRGTPQPGRTSGQTAGSAGAAPPPVAPGQLARHAMLAPRLPDCRAETRLSGDSSSRVRQEMTVLLAAPGLPLHAAPLLTAKQASSLMAAICEPLLSLPVGRLTRKLAAPTKLAPTEDRGVLSLWLLPDDSLSLVWQAAQQLGSAAVDDAVAGAAGGSSSSGIGAAGSSGGGGELPPLEQSCSVAVWEELAHFPAQAHLLDDAPVVTIHMLRGDASGRSFYIRVRSDVAEANLEAATAAVPDASRLLQQHRSLGTTAGPAADGSAAASAAGMAAEPLGAPRMYFWLADRDLGKAVYTLGRLKSLLKRPPTLARRSGVPERQLAQLGAWVQKADAAVAEQHRAAAAAAAVARQQMEAEQQKDAEEGMGAWDGGQPAAAAGTLQLEAGSTPPPAAAVAAASARAGPAVAPRGMLQLPPLLHSAACPPGLLLGQPGGGGMPPPAPHVPGSGMVPLLPAAPAPGQQAGAGASSSSSSGGDTSEPPVASGTSTVSATAAALYQDHRYNVVCPCTISVVVGMRVQGAGADPSLLPGEAASRARAVAERQAKSAVDRSGRQRIEERLAEVVIRNIRSQRNRARQARQAQRDSAARLQQAERALMLARQATGRALPAPAAAQAEAEPASSAAAAEAPSQQQQQQQPAQEQELRAEPSGSSPFGTAKAAAAAAPPSPSTSASIGQPGPRAFSSPAALPPPPTALLPGGRVTLGNLQSLLTPQQAGMEAGEPSAQPGSPPELSASAVAATAASAPPECPAGASSGRITVSDLADLLGKHAKLE